MVMKNQMRGKMHSFSEIQHKTKEELNYLMYVSSALCLALPELFHLIPPSY